MAFNLNNIVSKKTRRFFKGEIGRIKSAGKAKIFGIGMNKTGTTSLKTAMADLGYIIGDQRTAELLMDDWAKREFSRIIRYCKTAQFFQDVPFSKPYSYVILDHEFSGSKFILTIRDSADQWYHSLTKFHAKKWGKNGRIPTREDLIKASYIQSGWAWKMNRMSYNAPEDDPYNKKDLIQTYNDHNHSVREYFRYRQDDLLILNVAQEGAFQKLCDFLGVKSNKENFPWKNKTERKK